MLAGTLDNPAHAIAVGVFAVMQPRPANVVNGIMQLESGCSYCF